MNGHAKQGLRIMTSVDDADGLCGRVLPGGTGPDSEPLA